MLRTFPGCRWLIPLSLYQPRGRTKFAKRQWDSGTLIVWIYGIEELFESLPPYGAFREPFGHFF